MTENIDNHELHTISIEEEMKRSYLDYAMSVIVSRAIPDVRDGLKPVHRRILFSMHETSCDYNKPFRKSARIVGDVIGKYHPHSTDAIYDSLVRMAQDFSLRLPLIDGQGNFGSIDGDPPAAMRYTESRLEKVAHTMLEDLDKNTVDFRDNYDGTEREPVVLPAAFPNLLVNGAGGIAVGMATNIPTHNLGEIIDACCLYIENNDITHEDIMTVVLGPDFPTGGIILGTTGIKSAIMTGRGSIIIRGKANIEEIRPGRFAIIITEVPYMVNKAKMVERIAETVRDKRVDGISDLRDESDKAGMRVVVEIKRDAIPTVILNQLYSFTQLQTSFGVNMLALDDDGRPRVMNIKEVIAAFIRFREQVIVKRIIFLLNKVKDRAHILLGLLIAVADIDEIIKLIKSASDPTSAKEALLAKAWPATNVLEFVALIDKEVNVIIDGKCHFTEEQAKAILDMRLHRLTGLEHNKIAQELKDLALEIQGYLEILASREKLLAILKNELLEIKAKFATPRRTSIEFNEFEQDIEDLIQEEEMVVTVTLGGYIKRVPLSTYRAQRRGGKGRSGVTMHDEDVTTEVFIGSTHTPVLFFSSLGKVYKLKVYKLPLSSPQSKGKSLMNIFPLAPGEAITNVMPLPKDESLWPNLHIIFATKSGNIRRNDLSDFRSIQSNGKIAIKLDEGDKLIGVQVCTDLDHILLASRQGKCVRFPVSKVRVFKSRSSDGVRGIKLATEDLLVSMSILHGAEIDMIAREAYLKIPVDIRVQIAKSPDNIVELLTDVETTLTAEQIKQLASDEEFILTITENGFGKRTSAYEYRITNRGGSGIVNIVTSARNGMVISSFPISDSDQIMLITNKGMIIRCPVKDIRIAGRNTQGVVLFRTADDEKIVSTAFIAESEVEENIEGDDNAEA